MEAGNQLEDVRAWIGHRSVDQTAHYWESRPSSSLVVPWNRDDSTQETILAYYELAALLDDRRRLLATRLSVLRSSVLSPEQRDVLRQWEEVGFRNEGTSVGVGGGGPPV